MRDSRRIVKSLPDAGSIRLYTDGSRLKAAGYIPRVYSACWSRLPGIFSWRSFSLRWFLVATLLTGCVLNQQRIVITATPEPLATQSGAFTPTPSPYPWTDENATLSGICFEAALDAANQLFIMRNAAQMIEFYDLADNSQFCRHPVTRYPFDFSNGRVLAGLWSYGRGCNARHDVLDVRRDDSAKKLTIHLRFITEGDCNYELVQPFWMGLDGMEHYEIEVLME